MSIEPKKTEDYDVYEPEKNLGKEAYEYYAYNIYFNPNSRNTITGSAEGSHQKKQKMFQAAQSSSGLRTK